MARNFKAVQRADGHLGILQALAADPGYSMNHEMMAMAIDQVSAITFTESQVKERFDWLESQKLITTEIISPFVVAKLTDLGLKVAQGREHVEGVSRPSPGQM